MSAPTVEFLCEYARHRAAEGRALEPEALRALPYLRNGPLVRQWAVRARTFETFLRRVVKPMAATKKSPLQILDLGAGNGWLCHRVCYMGHKAVAVDVRDDSVDGLGAAIPFQREWAGRLTCVVASFEDLPLPPGQFDIVVFNASLHYARDLSRAIAQAVRMTRPSGVIAILDSPFYRRDAHGAAMVAEKHAQGQIHFGARADILLTQNFIEYLTRERLTGAAPNLVWVRHRIGYPLWYEMRPVIAWLKRARPPSRFDMWTARVS